VTKMNQEKPKYEFKLPEIKKTIPRHQSTMQLKEPTKRVDTHESKGPPAQSTYVNRPQTNQIDCEKSGNPKELFKNV